MNRGRPRTVLGTFGEIAVTDSGRYRASTRHRDLDGRLRKVSATATSKKGAEALLKRATLTSVAASRCGHAGFGRARWRSSSSSAGVKWVGTSSGACAGSVLTTSTPNVSWVAIQVCHSSVSRAASQGWISTVRLLLRRSCVG